MRTIKQVTHDQALVAAAIRQIADKAQDKADALPTETTAQCELQDKAFERAEALHFLADDANGVVVDLGNV